MISLNAGSKNQLLVNPRVSDDEKNVLSELQAAFEKSFGTENYFLVPSSGSSKTLNQSVKLIALPVESILNSARRVNSYLTATANDNWGLCLPEFHVAGLGVISRAYLSGSGVKKITFNADVFSESLKDQDIHFLSLVPAQVYDLAKISARAPATVKKVFVGGGFLSEGLRSRAVSLGWPVTETYGMTETSSMIALREAGEKNFRLMNGVTGSAKDGRLVIACDSLLRATIQKTDGRIALKTYEDRYETEDEVIITENNSGVYLELKGRSTDYIKILGEGVSLAELRNILLDVSISENLNSGQVELLALDDERSGYRLVLVFEAGVAQSAQNKVQEQFNSLCRPYEKALQTFVLRQIPRTDLGKLKTAELKRIIKEQT
jgi:O-succinylbenzoic acid--CoA ligase